jgi:hypothetical protein
MNKLPRTILHVLAVLVPIAVSAMDAKAQGSGEWKFIAEDEISRTCLRADSIVDEGNGVKVVGVRVIPNLKEAADLGRGRLDRFDAHYHPGHRGQMLETHERMGERLVHTDPPRGDPLERVPDNPGWRPVFTNVCGTGA